MLQVSIYSIDQKEGKYGIIDKNGCVILPHVYFGIQWANYKNLFIVKKAVDDSFYWAQSLNCQHYTVGLFNAETKHWILDCDYYSIWTFDPKYDVACVVKRHDGHSSGFINEDGVFIIPPQYDMPFWDHFDIFGNMPLVYNGKWGILDGYNNIRMPFKYDSIERFYDNDTIFAKFQESGKFGFIDKHCNIVIPAQYKSSTNFFNAAGYWRAIVEEGNSFFIVDEKGKHISIGYRGLRIHIDEIYYAEALCFSLFKGGGWHWERISTIHGDIIGGTGLDRKSKDLMVKAVIYGSTAVAGAAASALAKAIGGSIPGPIKRDASARARDRAWSRYKETDSVYEALSALFE